MSKVLAKRKFRRVDPLFLQKNKILTLSSQSKEFTKLLTKAKIENDHGTPIPILEYFGGV